ncbi:MAG: hypothetical protein JWM10_262 [Myxococcaceae bacterium]|nr:hypothetical protein [Myxococcaceae bacterium]
MSLAGALFGQGEKLTPIQMGCRGALMFFIALALVRLAGMRSFGRKSAFDRTVAIMLGAVLARGVVGASPFAATVAGGAAIVVVHRLLAHLCRHSPALEKLIKGEHHVLCRDGVVDERAMSRSGLTRADLLEGVRHSAQVESLDQVAAVYVESSGELSTIERPR